MSYPDIKTCGVCRTPKPPTAFYVNRHSRDGLQSACSTCQRQRLNEHRRTHGSRRKNLRSHHSITVEAYDTLLAAQASVCAICQRPETQVSHRSGRVKALSVDHDHKCCPGYRSCESCTRGLLCNACNLGLGRFEENIESLRRAITYLESYS